MILFLPQLKRIDAIFFVWIFHHTLRQIKRYESTDEHTNIRTDEHTNTHC